MIKEIDTREQSKYSEANNIRFNADKLNQVIGHLNSILAKQAEPEQEKQEVPTTKSIQIFCGKCQKETIYALTLIAIPGPTRFYVYKCGECDCAIDEDVIRPELISNA